MNLQIVLGVTLLWGLATICNTAPAPGATWVDTTGQHFSTALSPSLSITGIADWSNTMASDFIVRKGSRVELWGGTPIVCRWSSLPLPQPKEGSRVVVSTLVADLRRTGQLDVLIQASDGSLYWINGSVIHETTSPEPLAVEVSGEGVRLALLHSTGPQIALAALGGLCDTPDVVYVNDHGELLRLQLVMDDTVGVSSCQASSSGLRYHATVLQPSDNGSSVHPFSLLQADVRGRCVAELLYVVRGSTGASLQAYDAAAMQTRTLVNLPRENASAYGVPSVLDVDGDGSPDVVFPVCSVSLRDESGTCTAYDGLHVFYNTMQLTFGACGAAHEHGLEPVAVAVPLHLDACQLSDGAMLTLPHRVEAPLVVRSGDYNRDGRADIVLPSSRGPLVLTGTGNRLAPYQCAPLDPAYVEVGAVPFFLNIAEPGRLDIVLTTHTEGSTAASPVKTAVYAFPFLSNRLYYIVGSALNGVSGNVAGGYGLAQPGAVHYVAWQDVRMHPHVHLTTQGGHTVGHVLGLPRVVIGIGETFSYAQGYTVGIVASGPAVRRRWWPVFLVPNTQVFAFMRPMGQPDAWVVRLYLPTRRYLLLLGAALTVGLVTIGAFIVWLRWRDMWADYREWKQR